MGKFEGPVDPIRVAIPRSAQARQARPC
jgi:hypothetical protein